jgi:hypothetical protein
VVIRLRQTLFAASFASIIGCHHTSAPTPERRELAKAVASISEDSLRALGERQTRAGIANPIAAADTAASRVARIQVTPDSLVFHVGETIEYYMAVEISAYDSSNVRLRGFVPQVNIVDRSVVTFSGPGLKALQVGNTELTIVPMAFNRNIHPASVRAVVRLIVAQ